MKELKCITIYPEVYNNKDLTPTEKIYLSVIRYFTLNGKTRCCRLSDKEMSEELLIGIPSIWNMKSKLKKLGLITIGENCIKYASSNNEETSSNNEETSSNNEENPCNTNENQQVTEVNKYNKKEIKKEKNKKEIKEKEKQEKEKSFLDDWEREALLKKKEYKDNSSNNSNSDSCSIVDMVMGLPTKEDVPIIKDEPENKIETDKQTIIDALAKKMVDKISYSIKTQVNQIRHECDKQMFLKENEFNELQLTKHIKEYIKDRDLTKMLQDVTVFDRFAINAFNSYKNEIKRTINKLPKNNPYSDLDGSNSSYNDYRETNRWER